MHFNRIQPEEQVAAKPSGRDFFFEIRIRCGQNSHIDALSFRRADAFEFSGFEHAKQLGLLVERDVGDFVEKQRPAIGKVKTANAVGLCVGECAFDVAEHFAFENAFGETSDIDRDHRLRSTFRQRMKCFGDDFLSRAVLAGDQNVSVRWAHPGDELQNRLHGGRLGDERGPVLGAEQLVLRFETPFLPKAAAEFDLSPQNVDSRAFSHGF